MRTPYPIALKFGTQTGGGGGGGGGDKGASQYQLWLEYNKQAKSYERLFTKITPICYHTYRVNHVWEEAENWCVNRLTIEPQTFCGLKEIELKTRKIQ